jgi:radical SAM superfamily enzyme YgiQ (UPF0313 family)
MPSYGVRRIQAAVVSDLQRPDHVVRLFDRGEPDVEAYVRDILEFEPEILGLSIYVWSTACLVAVAQEVKRRRPGCVIVFGGPSARPSVFDLPAYVQAKASLDVLVEGDGEMIFRRIARLPELARSGLETIPGLTLPAGDGWHQTGAPASVTNLDGMPSPFQLGLMPHRSVAYLETFRGCPLSCRFCEWGTPGRTQGVFSPSYIARELRAFERTASPVVFLLDAGLNLNMQGFRNLRDAARETGVLKEMELWAEIYPISVRDEHLEFLAETGPAYLGVGLQSMDPGVLKLHQRTTDMARFEQSVRRLAEVTTVELQIIMALPGDTPAGFRRTLDFALSLPAAVRAYHCLVLPDALLTRGLPDWNMVFDQHSLAMTSCLGWTEEDILGMRRELTYRSVAASGRAGDFWWSFPAPKSNDAVRRPAMPMLA